MLHIKPSIQAELDKLTVMKTKTGDHLRKSRFYCAFIVGVTATDPSNKEMKRKVKLWCKNRTQKAVYANVQVRSGSK